MKNTEQRWMHISTGLLVDRGRKPDNSANDYRPVTVTWDEPEYEDVEVVRWGIINQFGEPNTCLYTEEEYAIRDAVRPGESVVRIPITYRRRKPEPEVEVVERPVVDNTGWTGCVIDLPHEWIGKRVRVEVVE